MRFGQRLGLQQEHYETYKQHHVRIWPEIAAAIHDAGIRNYSIFHLPPRAGENGPGELFGYYEYIGPPDEYRARMQRLAAAPRMRQWWDLMEAMQVPDARRRPGEWWASMEEVFHQD